MVLAAAASPDIVLLFAAAGLLLYVASRAAVDALTVTADPSPGRMAVAQWMPVAWLALLATGAGHAEVGVGVAMATSVAALALNLGVLVLLAPPENPDPSPAPVSDPDPAPVPAGRAWPFVIPAALLALLAGFSGFLNVLHALMLLVLGGCVLAVWQSGPTDDAAPLPPARRRVRPVQLLLAIALAGVGAWIGFQGILIADSRTRVATAGLIAAAVMSPLLVLPALGAGAVASQNGRTGHVMATLVGITLLNLCLLLPAVVLLGAARQLILAWRGGTRELAELLAAVRPMPFPIGVWRVDTVLLIVLGLLLVPISLGRWSLKKGEGIALALGYVAYLLVSTAIAVRL